MATRATKYIPSVPGPGCLRQSGRAVAVVGEGDASRQDADLAQQRGRKVALVMQKRSRLSDDEGGTAGTVDDRGRR